MFRLSSHTRRWVVLLSVLTACRTLALVTTGVLTGSIAADTVTDPSLSLSDHAGPLLGLGILVAVQVVLAWAEKRYSHRAAARATEDLRVTALGVLAVSDPRRVDRAIWRTLLTEGVEGLGPYLTGYLPALVSTVVTVPVTLVVIWWLDAGSALIAVVTLPLTPVFMWLVGTLTAGRTERKLADLGVLTDQMLDLIAGLPTLKGLGRVDTPVAEVDRLSGQHRRSTMSVLRVAFLSSMVLEFLATLSIALVAVGIGFRLLDGSMTLAAGLTVLIVIPEVYNPVRQVGARFHDAKDGFVAVDSILTLLDEAGTTETSSSAPRPSSRSDGAPSADTDSGDLGVRVVFSGLRADGRDGPRPRDVTGTAAPGELTVLSGPNGSGKTTALLALLGIATDGIHGRADVTVDGTVYTGRPLWERTSYLPQRPVLDPTLIGDTSELSLGQQQRRALDEELGDVERPQGRQAPGSLLVLDEPTAHLDTHNAVAVMDRLRRWAAAGATVVAASHDPVVVNAADNRIEVE
ncbi:ABC transporter transmembrane domain-containing protein [Corynebacterium sp.]|uniref:ABC transporter transmembrane domain-containing protein n=1 Tax=Corynebacterium sp. TaxID=1720 RepID=UPI0021015B2E|nr:ABC transporter transmembrane domain-containing protein [Corynebacterium sp. CNJ-954]